MFKTFKAVLSTQCGFRLSRSRGLAVVEMLTEIFPNFYGIQQLVLNLLKRYISNGKQYVQVNKVSHTITMTFVASRGFKII